MRLSDPNFDPIWQKAVEEFNSEHFFECHETLEAFWLICSDPIEKDFLQGIIQTAAAMIKLKEKNYKGLKSLIARAFSKLTHAINSPLCSSLLDLNNLMTEIEKIKIITQKASHLDTDWKELKVIQLLNTARF